MRIPAPILAAAVALSVAACGPFDPETRAHRAYVRDMQPLLVENALLADRVLHLAARVYNDPKTSAGDLAQDWTQEVVPLSEHLHGQATFLEPAAPWVEAHAELVDIWSERAQAYRTLSEALVLADANQWESAYNLARDVKIREEDWFRRANQTLAPKGLLLDQFP